MKSHPSLLESGAPTIVRRAVIAAFDWSYLEGGVRVIPHAATAVTEGVRGHLEGRNKGDNSIANAPHEFWEPDEQ